MLSTKEIKFGSALNFLIFEFYYYHYGTKRTTME